MAEKPSDKRRFIEGGNLDLLHKLLAGSTQAQAGLIVQGHIGEWAQVTGRVSDVTALSTHVAVSVYLATGRSLYLMFEKGSIDVLLLGKEDEIAVQGRIEGYLACVTLANCEIVSHATRLELLTREIGAAADKARLEASTVAVDETDETTDELPPRIAPDRPRLPDAALQLWYEAFKKAYPHGSQSLAEKSAQGAFPDHHVARSRVREFFPDLARGRPKKSTN